MQHASPHSRTTSPVLAAEKVTFGYAGNDPLFHEMDLHLAPGERVHLCGPSGAGKTTLLRLMAGLELPASGVIRFDGIDTATMPPPLFRRSIVYLQQVPVVLEASVRDNLLLPFTFAAAKDIEPPEDSRLQRSLESLFPEGIRLDQAAPELSVGQQQRLCFARALLLHPRVLLLDEPVSALDSDSAGLVMAAALDANRTRDTALLLNTHTAEDGSFAPHRCLAIERGILREEKRS